MSGQQRVRTADLGTADAVIVAGLVEEYLRQTEREKAEHGEPAAGRDEPLPERYRAEVDDPATAFAEATVLIAELDGVARGVVITRDGDDGREIKRLWVDPTARGARLGSALLAAATGGGVRPVRLSVWDWRERVIEQYERHGFTRVPSWETRERLVCLQLD